MKVDTLKFRERLLPSFWVFVVALAFMAMLAIAIGAAYFPELGWVIFGGLGTLTIAGLFIGSPVLTVSDTDLVAGPARLPRAHIGVVQVLDAKQMRAAQHEALRFMLVRTWHARGGVLVQVTDIDDPHPAWLLTTREPAKLAVALRPVEPIG